MTDLKILFVCTGNAHRSPLAEALLKKLRPDWQVESAGMQVAIPISEAARRYLRRENAEGYLKATPEDLGNKRLEEYDLIVTMEKTHKDFILSRCPECENKIAVWNIEDPYFLGDEHAERVYGRIKKRVIELARS